MKTKEELFSKLPKVKKTDKVIILSHTDLDGSGAIIVANLVFHNCSHIHCGNAEMSEKIYDCISLINKDKLYDFVIATDISVNEETAVKINEEFGDCNNFVILDHHKTALHLNNYDWAVVEPELVKDSFRAKYYDLESDKQMLSSGTSLFFDYLDYIGIVDSEESHSDIPLFVHQVATYDTFNWKNYFKEERKESKCVQLNDIFIACGQDVFETRYIEHLRDSYMKMGSGYYDLCYKFYQENDLLLLIQEEKKRKYLDRVKQNGCLKYKLYYKGNEYSLSVLLGGDYLSDTFDLLKEISPSDVYAIHYFIGTSEQISLRSDVIDVSEFAKYFGGGGHPAAAGFTIPYDKKYSQMKEIYGNTPYPNYSDYIFII